MVRPEGDDSLAIAAHGAPNRLDETAMPLIRLSKPHEQRESCFSVDKSPTRQYRHLTSVQ